MSVGEIRNVLAYWRIAADREGALQDEDRAFERRRLFVSPTWGGMVRVDGDLDPETGQTLITALRAVTDAEARAGAGSDPRSPAQRRADALGEVCRGWLASLERPSVAGEVPHVVVTMDLAALQARGGRSALEDVGPITPEAARRLACDANVTRVITDTLRAAGRRTTDQGRATRTPASRDGSRSRVPVPRVRSSTGLVRCTPRCALGRRWRDLARQPGAAVSAAPSGDPSRVRRADGRRVTGILQT